MRSLVSKTERPEIKKYPFTAPVDPVNPFITLHEPLGALVVHFADLEMMVGQIVNTLLRIDPVESLVLDWLMPNFNQRIELMHYLCVHRAINEEHKKYGEKIIS